VNQTHIIGRTVLEIEIDRLDDVWSFQAEISDILQQQGVPAMEQLFDRLVGSDRVIRLDRIVLDLPPIDRHFLADEFVRNLLAALNLALTDRESIDSTATKIQTRPGADGEVLLYFLQYGRLPWWCPTTDWQTWLPRWETVMQTGTDWQSPLRTLLRTYPAAQQRLIDQFVPGFRHQLILQLQPTWLEWSNLLAQAQQLIQALGLSRSNCDRLEHQAWLLLLNELVQAESSFSRPLPTTEWIHAWLRDLIQTWQPTTSPNQSPTADRELELRSIDPQTMIYQRLRTLMLKLPSAARSQWLTTLDLIMPPQTRWQSLSERESPHLDNEPQTLDLRPPSIDTTADAPSPSQPSFPATVQTNQIDRRQGSSDLQLSPEETSAGLFVDRAGLILLHPFLSPYFAEVGLLDGEVFRDEAAQQTAIYLLHYLATGATDAPESELVIPKLLCGWHLNAPVIRGIELPPTALTEGEHLLQTAIDYWQVLKDTSPDGLREGFLQRTGKLTLQDDGNWRLQVEQQSIDILLGSLPWGINVVTLPWLECLIMVEWS
jgi:Contractile injection system tape measure protein